MQLQPQNTVSRCCRECPALKTIQDLEEEERSLLKECGEESGLLLAFRRMAGWCRKVSFPHRKCREMRNFYLFAKISMEKLGKILVSKQEICFFIVLLLLYENKVKLNFQYSLDHMRHILPMLKPCEKGRPQLISTFCFSMK